jgi:hypothetical protein
VPANLIQSRRATNSFEVLRLVLRVELVSGALPNRAEPRTRVSYVGVPATARAMLRRAISAIAAWRAKDGRPPDGHEGQGPSARINAGLK